MQLDYQKPKKEKFTYPAIAQALSAAPEDLKVLRRAYSLQELKALDEQFSRTWSAQFLPELLAEARKRLEGQDQKMEA